MGRDRVVTVVLTLPQLEAAIGALAFATAGDADDGPWRDGNDLLTGRRALRKMQDRLYYETIPDTR